MGTEREPKSKVLVRGSRFPQIDLGILEKITRRPRLFSKRRKVFWSDPYVSEHVLNAHLDPDTEAATRHPAKIEKTVEFLVGLMSKGSVNRAGAAPGRILDLGCGPGLYAERLASRGYSVTGMDISPASIRYATKRASEAGLRTDYRRTDFRRAALGGPYDAVIQIYGEFCTLTPSELGAVLHRVRESLRPGGILLFDVFNERHVNRIRTGDNWYVSLRDGFWQDEPHMVLEQVFRYDNELASVMRYTIISEDGSYRQFSVWWRHYSAHEIQQVVVDAGFTDVVLHGSVWGSPVESTSEWIGVVCRRSI